MALDPIFDLGPAAFGFAVARSHTEFSSQTLKSQSSIPNSGHNGPRLDASAQANLFQVF
jgi:hypothetical protein